MTIWRVWDKYDNEKWFHLYSLEVNQCFQVPMSTEYGDLSQLLPSAPCTFSVLAELALYHACQASGGGEASTRTARGGAKRSPQRFLRYTCGPSPYARTHTRRWQQHWLLVLEHSDIGPHEGCGACAPTNRRLRRQCRIRPRLSVGCNVLLRNLLYS